LRLHFDLNDREYLALVVFLSLLLLGEIGIWFYKFVSPPTYEVLKQVNERVLEEDQKININQASYDELLNIPGVGPKLAKRIIAGRPYRTIEDLLKVKGIGKKKLEKIKPYIEIK
jgi:competence protein ComEA